MAGLSACWAARKGATGIVVPFNKAKDAGMWTHFATDLGFPEDAWTPMHVGWERSDTGFYYEGHGWVKNPWRDGFKHAPIPDAAKKALVDMELYRTPPRRADWEPWLDSMTYADFLTNVVGIDKTVLPDVLKYLNPMTCAMGCGLSADVISAYSAYNFIQPGVVGYYRYQTGGVDPTDEIYLASFPGGHPGTARHFLKKILPAALKGEYKMADILNSPVQWDQLDRANQPVRMRLSSTVVSVAHEGPPDSAKHVVVTYSRNGKLYRVRAKGVILCGQQHANRHMLACSFLRCPMRK